MLKFIMTTQSAICTYIHPVTNLRKVWLFKNCVHAPKNLFVRIFFCHYTKADQDFVD